MRFADPKLQLAMIDEVHRRRGAYSWVVGERASYQATGPGTTWTELEDNQCDHAPELEAFLARLPIAQADLDGIEHLTLDGDRDLYGWVYPSWWDFGDHFAIHDLDGIEACTRLKYLLLGQGLVEGASLKPVSRLPRLVELHLCARCHLRDISSLLDLTSLRTLDVVNVATSEERDTWEPLITELLALGVTVAARQA